MQTRLVYNIDAGGIIVAVDERWKEFWRANSAAGQPMREPVGTLLWSHFSDPTTVHLYEAMLARVRLRGKPLTVPFRCDAPDRRRYLELHIERLPAGIIQFSSVTLREEPRQWMPLLDARPRVSAKLIRMCSWCKRVALPDWVEVEESVRRLRLFEPDAQVPGVTHSICETCAASVLETLKRLGDETGGR